MYFRYHLCVQVLLGDGQEAQTTFYNRNHHLELERGLVSESVSGHKLSATLPRIFLLFGDSKALKMITLGIINEGGFSFLSGLGIA